MASEEHILLPASYLCAILVLCTWTDVRRRIIPNAANFALFVGALLHAAASPEHAIRDALLGSALGMTTFLLIAIGFRKNRGYEGLGFGDVKFMAGAGAWVGWQGLAPLVLIASVSALIYIAGLRLRTGVFDPSTRLPFAPFLSLGTIFIWSIQMAEIPSWTMFQR